MKKAYAQSYWFWVTSKILLVILLLISTLSILGVGDLRSEELAVNVLALVEGLLLIVTLFHDFSSANNFSVLKLLTGAIMTLFGLALFVVLLTISKSGQSSFYFLGFPLALWMVLVGIFDLLRINKPTSLERH